MDQTYVLGYVAAFLLGAILGSVANGWIYWLMQRRALVSPGVPCSTCQRTRRPWHTIPLLGVVLRGQCATCHTAMAWRSLLVELLCGALYVLLYHQWPVSVPSVVFALLAVVLLVVACIDLAHTIIPDAITLPGILAGLLASLVLTPVGIGNALIGALLGGSVFFMIAVLSRDGMGGGDIKLIAMIGAFLGWHAVLTTMFLGALFLTLLGLILMLVRQKRRQDPLPFGPFLATGALLTMVWGDALHTWYQQLML
jgi:leader peptidase (prepilin peptidase) / N-methyltransferase